MSLLEIRNLHARIGDKPILHGLDLVVNPGEVHAIMGPNASGKSTLAKVITGREEYAIEGVENGEASEVTVRADDKEFRARVRLDTPREREYLRHGGILPFVLRRLLG